MKVISAFVAMFVLNSPIKAEALDALIILKRDLGAAIEVISEGEIRYCPDNTCEIFRMQTSRNSSYLPSFVFLHLFHQSGYIYLKESIGGSQSFLHLAAGNEPAVRAQVIGFCKERNKTVGCILKGMRQKMNIKITSGRYDEGRFDES